MASILKTKYWIPMVVSIFLLGSFSMQAQDYSDKEIGFDRAGTTKELLEHNPSMKNEELESILSEMRRERVNYRRFYENQLKLKSTADSPVTQAITECSAVRFDGTNPFHPWEVYTFPLPYAGISTSNIVWQPVTGTNIDGTQLLLEYTNTPESYRFKTLNKNDYDGEMYSQDLLKSNGNITVNDIAFPGGQNNIVARVGNRYTGAKAERLRKKITVNSADDIIKYSFAVVLQKADHDSISRPRFAFRLNRILPNGSVAPSPCTEYEFIAPGNGAGISDGFRQLNNTSVYIRPWRTNVIKPSDLNPGLTYPAEFYIDIMALDCTQGAHFGYAYFDISCGGENNDLITVNSDAVCEGEPATITANVDPGTYQNYSWVIKDGSGTTIYTSNNAPASFGYDFPSGGSYTIYFTAQYIAQSGCTTNITTTAQLAVDIPDCVECVDCTSFNPIPTEKYLISGWVREMIPSNPTAQYKNYESSLIAVSFKDVAGNIISTGEFLPTGSIIDGWQRIIGEFVVPGDADDIDIYLVNNDSKKTSYFDDIRVFPNRGSMKSFAYDQNTQKLMAELDDNNYATFYEYDLEGGLIRIKKETEKGIYTIQEFRTNNVKTK